MDEMAQAAGADAVAFRLKHMKDERARAVIEEKESSNKSQIVITEIPYQVNSANLLVQIRDLVKDAKLTGISDLRNESDRDGMRLVVELKRDAIPRVVLNQLYKHTQLQENFGANMLAIVDGIPAVGSSGNVLRPLTKLTYAVESSVAERQLRLGTRPVVHPVHHRVDLRALRDPFRGPAILVGGAQHHLRRLPPQRFHHVRQVRRRGLEARLGLDGRPAVAYYSGDTIVQQGFWGERVLPTLWSRHVFGLAVLRRAVAAVVRGLVARGGLLDRAAALLARLDRVVGHALHDLERVALLAAVLVDRHWHSQYTSAKNGFFQAFLGGLGLSRSSSSDTRAACHTIQAVRWEIGRKAIPTISDPTVPRERTNSHIAFT